MRKKTHPPRSRKRRLNQRCRIAPIIDGETHKRLGDEASEKGCTLNSLAALILRRHVGLPTVAEPAGA